MLALVNIITRKELRGWNYLKLNLSGCEFWIEFVV